MKNIFINFLRKKKKSKVIAEDKNHLLKLMKKEILQYGNECDLNHIDVSQITEMDRLFPSLQYEYLTLNKKLQFNGDISQWDTSNVTNMVYMFLECHFNGDISRWNTSKVENMFGMFKRSSFNGDISKWNISNVWNTGEMFMNSQFNGDISKWDISSIKHMDRMFAYSTSTYKEEEVRNSIELLHLKEKINQDYDELNKELILNSNKNYPNKIKI